MDKLCSRLGTPIRAARTSSESLIRNAWRLQPRRWEPPEARGFAAAHPPWLWIHDL